MGDQVGETVSGKLYFVPYREFERILALKKSPVEISCIFASLCRINALYMIAKAGSGHIGSSFSSMDVMSWLQINEINNSFDEDGQNKNNIFFSSKGHDAPALYSTMIGLGVLDFELLHRLRRLGGLPGHPDIDTPNIVTNTGSLGMGVSKAKGMIFSNRFKGKKSDVYVLTGDGELQEGQFWESLVSAANHKLGELTVVIDHNKLQSDTLVSKVSDLGDLEAKLKAFGWWVSRCDGNNIAEFAKTVEESKKINDQPKIIIADTVKGKGVSFMEHHSFDSDVELYQFHSGAPSAQAYTKACQELIDATNSQLQAIGETVVALEHFENSSPASQKNPQRLIQAYSSALLEQAREYSNIVVLDADLILDTGLIPFKEEFPERFVECGIAEQDMVSQAGGMALQGILPIVHSFACFLSSRANEQIYNNSTERTKIIYVGSLAGVVPGGPGHSHQAVRDISSLSGVPGLVLVEPCCESEVELVVDWAINQNELSTYIRLTSIPWVTNFSLPPEYKPVIGQGVSLTKGNDAAIIAYGPVMLTIAVNVANEISAKYGLSIKVINLPWLNNINNEWFEKEMEGIPKLFSIDNHYLVGGQGDRIAEALCKSKLDIRSFERFGLDSIPVCGTNEEVLANHQLDEHALRTKILSILKRS